MFFIFQTVQDVEKNEPDIKELICKYSKDVTRLCYMILKDVHLADEASWDTLYKVYKSYNKFRGDSSEKTWVTQIAINICKNYMRKSSYKEIVNSEYISLDYVSDDEALAEYKSQDSVELLNAVYNLPEKYKQVILLRYYKEMSVSEISKMLKEKNNTISVRIKRALALLKESLKEE